MNSTFILEQIEEGVSTPIAQLAGAYYTIGREAEDADIVIPNSAISRQHAILLSCGSVWLCQDVGSTNGSWINGLKLPVNQWHLLRSGDDLQLANLDFRITEGHPDGDDLTATDISTINHRTLIVLRNEQFVSELPVPEYGRALVLGGSTSDMELPGDLFEQPSLVIERRGEDVVVYSVAKEFPVTVNDTEITELTVLKDCDSIRLLNYTIFFNEPAINQAQTPPSTVTEVTSNLKEWVPSEQEEERERRVRAAAQLQHSGTFGVVTSEDEFGDETFALDYPRVRKGANHQNLNNSFASLEDKLILSIGFGLLLVLLGFIVVWVLIN